MGLLDGKVISAPNVNQAIAGGRAQIEGGFTVAEMRDLVIQLKAGALPLPVELLSDRIVGPSIATRSRISILPFASFNRCKAARILGPLILPQSPG